jgi:hypothetical protein
MEIIMFAGGIGSGKAYLMNKFVAEKKETGNRVALISFADPIKKLIKDLFGYDKNGVRLNEGKEGMTPVYILNKIVGECIEYANLNKEIVSKTLDLIKETNLWLQDEIFNAFDCLPTKPKESVRKLMQIVGTDIGHTIKKDMWPHCACSIIDRIENYFDYVIIDDWRFLFEFITLQVRYQHKHKVSPYYVYASPETCAKRRGVSVLNWLDMSNHSSEREGLKVILPYMEIYYPENIIQNDKDSENEVQS